MNCKSMLFYLVSGLILMSELVLAQTTIYIPPGETKSLNKNVGSTSVLAYPFYEINDSFPGTINVTHDDLISNGYAVYARFDISVAGSVANGTTFTGTVTYRFYNSDHELKIEKVFDIVIIASEEPENQPPALSNGQVTPQSGGKLNEDTYRYSVICTDTEGDEPSSVYVCINSGTSRSNTMIMNEGSGDIRTGKEYYQTVNGSYLMFGTNTFRFQCTYNDGTWHDLFFPSSGSFEGPITHNIDFSASPRTGSAPLSVNFTDLTVGDPRDWNWSFGDGATSSTQNPLHTYSTPGTYNVTLNAISVSQRDEVTKTNYITVTEPQTEETVSTPNQPSGPSSGKAGQSLSFTTGGSNSNLGHNVEYQFDWGDGSQSSWGALTKSHTFSSTGTKYVKARARCQTHTSIVSSWSSTKSVAISYCILSITINPAGKGSVNKNPDKTNFTYNETVQLTASAISGYYFNSWDGALSGSSNPQTLTMSGDKSVTVNFTQSQSQETISTPNQPSGPSSGKVGQSLSFSTGGSNSNLGHNVEYQFDWGDGSQSSWGASTKSHTFSSTGTKYVKARARCQTHTSIVSGWSSTKSVAISYCVLSITINPAGKGSVNKNPDKTNFTYNETVQLTANPISGYYFNTWDGALSGSANPQTLTMSGDKSVTANFTQNQSQETVSTPNKPSGPSSGKVGQSLAFTTGGSSSNLGHTVEYQFDWGDGSQSSWGALTKSHAFSSSGTKYVKARARCQTHTGIVSGWSGTKSVALSYCNLVLSSSPSGSGSVNKTPNKTNFSYNETVQLEAVANSGFTFDYWGGISGSVNPKNITMTQDKDVTAYFTSSSDVTCESNDIENIKSFRLKQNYPNPFNPETTISFQLPTSSYVKLAIYNLSGQLIETLVDGYHTAGEYNVKWQPGGLANGIYLYRLKADNYIETRKLILQK